MTDLVERLRHGKNCSDADCYNGSLMTEAAAEIERLSRLAHDNHSTIQTLGFEIERLRAEIELVSK